MLTVWDCRLSTKAWSVSTHYVLLGHIPCRTWSKIIFQRRLIKDTLAPIYMSMSEEDSNVTSLPYIKTERTGQSCVREDLAVCIHITPKSISSWVFNLTCYSEASIQKLVGWTQNKKKKQKKPSDFLFSKEKEIVQVTLEATEVSKPRLSKKVLNILQDRYSMSSGCS